ncbi:hypothetical protein EC844_14012 [Acinetobacter calcoaceticus]|uniref:Tle cognate immunity protein 4 C-terminal domain-containing protein n=1 Tax=Acinetobacter calcoaceticus TaxID=471 RepID=A0A4R1XJ85_ACICA|nr:hypothetical protein EC844_14012 [Acinetobacter calcoaceticus]
MDLTLESESVYEDDGGLINRTKNNLKEEGALDQVLSSIHTLRKGTKKVNQFNGEEWIIAVPMKGRNGIESSWAYSGVANNNLYPSIQLDFTNGRDSITNPASISNKEAEYLYSEILKSIRYF